ncbi:MAG: DUF2298 domain-containing protein [Chloroflexota bacterium]
MGELITWLVVVEAFGLAALPVGWWLLRNLPDRGIAFAKPLGLLLVGYFVWAGSAFGFLANARDTIVLCLALLAGVGWLRFGSATFVALRERARTLVASEFVFLLAFALAAILRAYNPDIAGTEKPMDFAFFNAALRDSGVPPQDPWLAGFGISYYYFGYFLLAMLAKVAGAGAGVAYNLALCTLFGLAATGAFGLVANLVAARESAAGRMVGAAVRHGVLAAGLLLLLSNLEGFLEVLYINNVLPLSFWQGLGIKDLLTPHAGPLWYPSDPPDTWWWWRASRVVGEFNPVTGVTADYTINEFPFFSFLLGDLHPHVMALPFLLLSLALVLNYMREGEEVSVAWLRRQWPRALVGAVVFGALGFLNSWDLPTLLFILVLGVGAQQAATGGAGRGVLAKRAFGFGGLALVAAVVLYLPFYIGLRTQASGIGVVGTRTKVQQLLVVWAPLMFTAAAFPVYYALAGPRRGLYRALATVAGAAALATVVALMALDDAALRRLAGDLASVPSLLLGAATSTLLVVLLIPTIVAYWRLLGVGEKARSLVATEAAGGQAVAEMDAIRYRVAGTRFVPEEAFAVILVGTGLLLILGSELVFVRDGFGNRMNTVFKLYYQAWMLLAVAAAYTLYFLDLRRRLAHWRGPGLAGYVTWRALATVLLVAGLAYTVLAPISKTGNFARQPTLDGTAWLRSSNPQEYEAIAWLGRVPGTPVILEAPGAEYSDFNRTSAYTGLPSVLGWAGHEYQWRGNTPEPTARKADVDTIYRTSDVSLAEGLLRKYGVSYIVVGDAEWQTYSRATESALTKFTRFADVAFRNDRVTIYRVR